MWVSFRYTVVVSCWPHLSTRTSRNGSVSWFSTSMVNSMLFLWELRCVQNSLRRVLDPCSQMRNVSSTYLSYNDDLRCASVMADSPKNSMYRSAITGESGEPIEGPSICS